MIRDSTFSGNTMILDPDPEGTYVVGGRGPGALYVNVEDARIYDSTFENNYSYALGGAIMIAEGYVTSTVLLDNVTMTGNGIGPIAGNLTGEGGAISALQFTDGSDITVTIRNSTISGNSAFNGGGLLFQQGASGILENTTVDGNYATTSGGISFQPLSSFADPSYLNVIDSTISNNTAVQSGGGLFADDYYNYSYAQTRIEGTTISGNVALAAQDDGTGVFTGGHGGGLMATSTPLTVINSTISGNSACRSWWRCVRRWLYVRPFDVSGAASSDTV